MAVRVPLLLRRLRPALAHFVHSLPLALPCPAVLTVQDLSFERDGSLMGRRETAIFRFVVPRSARRARRVLAISQRTKDDLVRLYALAPGKIVVTPLAADPAFGPAARAATTCCSPARSRRARTRCSLPTRLPRSDAASSSPGPERDRALAAELRARGADVRGFVSKDELVRLTQEAAALLFPTLHEGFGLPVAEAMACGTPVVATPDPAVREVGGDAVAYAEPEEFAATLARVLADPEPWSRAGLERARALSWEHTAQITVDVYREVLA